MATQTWLWVFFFLQGRLPCNLASWGFQPPHPRPGPFCTKKALDPKACLRGNRQSSRHSASLFPLKTPPVPRVVTKKNRLLTAPRGNPRSGKIFRSRCGEPLRKIFRACLLWRTDRGAGVSPASFGSFLSPERNHGGLGVCNAP